jgi:hypothetical protein
MQAGLVNAMIEVAFVMSVLNSAVTAERAVYSPNFQLFRAHPNFNHSLGIPTVPLRNLPAGIRAG